MIRQERKLSNMRPIIDQVVEENLMKDPRSFETITRSPMYQGTVNKAWSKYKLTSIKGEPRMLSSSMVADIKNFPIKDEASYITWSDLNITVPVHPEMIKFIKVAITMQYSECIAYSTAVATYIKELLYAIQNKELSIPLNVKSDDKFDQVVFEELDYILKSVCDKNNITYSTVVDAKVKEVKAPKKKKSKNLSTLKSLAKGE